MNNYFVYDGRAKVDFDDACVLECFEAHSDKKAKKHYNKGFSGVDSVLTDDKQNIITTN